MSVKIRLADYVISTLVDMGVNVAFMVTGGMAMHLNDALAREKRMTKICHHHEQGAAYAAEGYGHISGSPALLQVTSGPGSINAMSGVFGAYVDSIPMLVISGQTKRELTRCHYGFTEMRQIGDQEADIISMVQPITKYACRIYDSSFVAFELGKAFHIATSGRPGPVWLEIPLDVQASIIEPDKLRKFSIPVTPEPDVKEVISSLMCKLKRAKRPLLVVGPDIRQAGDGNQFRRCAGELGIPIVTAGAQDTIANDHALYAGTMGTVGTRAGNIAVQNADFILFLGMRPYLGLVTFNWRQMGENAHKVVVDEDPNEFEKPCQIADYSILCGQRAFLEGLLPEAERFDNSGLEHWREWCRDRVRLLPTITSEMRSVSSDGKINPYWFVETLYANLERKDCIVAGNASSSIIPIQAGKLVMGQRFFSNHGNGAMGFALPAAIGASIAAPERRIICLEGDGSIMMNIQELQTVSHHKLPIVIVIFNNGGYLSIQQTQKNFFNRTLGSDPESGISFPDFTVLTNAFKIPSVRIEGSNFIADLEKALRLQGPLLIDAILDPAQGFEPKVASRKLPDGTMVSCPPEDMFPFLPADELAAHLAIRRSQQ